jgi:nucleotide-binding universal stress UspA family protein
MTKILAAVDFSKHSEAVLEQAAKLAKTQNDQLWILHVTSDETQAMAYEATQFSDYAPGFINMPGDVQLARDICADEFKREHSQLLAMSSKLRATGIKAQSILIKGDPASLILNKAKELNVETIVLGSHGHGLLHKVLLGSVSEGIIRNAHCNIMVVPPHSG